MQVVNFLDPLNAKPMKQKNKSGMGTSFGVRLTGAMGNIIAIRPNKENWVTLKYEIEFKINLFLLLSIFL